MATYTELYGLLSNSTLRNRIAVACVIAAEAIRTEDGGTVNHANRLTWAKAVFVDPASEASRMMMAVLAANNTLTTVQVLAASDAVLQTAVNAAVNVFATG